jgi:prepilin-type N-terminal cleavage/methylation domain-containing protein
MTEAAMTMRMPHIRRAMTLVELLVVIAIVGLLAVAVGPLFQGSSERRKFEEAAGVVSAHLNAAIAKSIGSADGAGAWLPVDSSTPGAVSLLAFTRPRPNVAGNVTVTNVTSGIASVTLSAVPSPAAGVLHVAGYPTPFELVNATQALLTGNIRFLPGYNSENCAFPATSGTYQFRASVPPRQRMTAGTRQLGGGYCIDLTASTIGVHGYTAASDIVPLNAVQTLAVAFDATGRATIAWTTNDNVSWTWTMLDARRPLALLVGLAGRVSTARVNSPTVDDPGTNIQSPDAKWIVIDPRSAIVRTIDNQFVPDASGTHTAAVTYAQLYVLQHLTNQ